MIQVETIDGVRKFRLARSLLGKGLYYTAAYWVDGLMIDTGCAYTVSELLQALKGLPMMHITYKSGFQPYAHGSGGFG